MKSILDSAFRYRPSFDTDLQRTFARVRREQQRTTRPTLPTGPLTGTNVAPIRQTKAVVR